MLHVACCRLHDSIVTLQLMMTRHRRIKTARYRGILLSIRTWLHMSLRNAATHSATGSAGDDCHHQPLQKGCGGCGGCADAAKRVQSCGVATITSTSSCCPKHFCRCATDPSGGPQRFLRSGVERWVGNSLAMCHHPGNFMHLCARTCVEDRGELCKLHGVKTGEAVPFQCCSYTRPKGYVILHHERIC